MTTPRQDVPLARQTSDESPTGTSALVLRHDRLRRLRACESLIRLTRARFDVVATTPQAARELVAAAGLRLDLEWQAGHLLTAPVDRIGLAEAAALLRELTAHERELDEQVAELTARVVEELQACPTACLP